MKIMLVLGVSLLTSTVAWGFPSFCLKHRMVLIQRTQRSMMSTHKHVTKVYKILTHQEWKQFQKDKSFEGNATDKKDGFIHLSKEDQVERVLNKYYKGESPVYIVELTGPDFVADLKWEKASNGDLYPHLYDKPLELKLVSTKTLCKNTLQKEELL